MPKKTFITEQIISKLRKAKVLLRQGQTVPAACKVIVAAFTDDKDVDTGLSPYGWDTAVGVAGGAAVV